MINFICGKPGSGKSLKCVELIIQELVHGKRWIVTNIQLKQDRIAENFGVDAFNRIRIIDEEETKDFYRRRKDAQGDYDLEVVHNKNFDYAVIKSDLIYDRDEEHTGTYYVIDEVHVHFHARQWAKVGMTAQHYFTQHRHLNDDILLNTQELAQVEKGLRELAQEYWVVQNLARQKKGFLRHSRVFKIAIFYNSNTKGVKPSEKEEFRYDIKVGECYDTSSGSGIQGRGAETTPYKKGIPIRGFVVACVLALPCALVALKMGANKGTEMLIDSVVPQNFIDSVNESQPDEAFYLDPSMGSDDGSKKSGSYFTNKEKILSFSQNGEKLKVLTDKGFYTSDSAQIEMISLNPLLLNINGKILKHEKRKQDKQNYIQDPPPLINLDPA